MDTKQDTQQDLASRLRQLGGDLDATSASLPVRGEPGSTEDIRALLHAVRRESADLDALADAVWSTVPNPNDPAEARMDGRAQEDIDWTKTRLHLLQHALRTGDEETAYQAAVDILDHCRAGRRYLRRLLIDAA